MKDDLIKLAWIFGSPKRTAILFVLSSSSSNSAKISERIRTDHGWKYSSSELYKNLHLLENLNMIRCEKHRWHLVPFGSHVIRTIKFLFYYGEKI